MTQVARTPGLVLKTKAQCSIAGMTPLQTFYAERNVLVVGADGFLGVNCVHALRALGANVAVLSRRAAPRAGRGAGAVFHGDLRDPAVVHAVVAGQEIVFDFAGATGALDSNSSPLRNIDLELSPHLTLIRACADSPQPPLLMFCSSRLVYGRPRYLPVDERHPLDPASMYAAHKIAVENYLAVFRHTHKLHSCVVRLSNPYGRHDDPGAKTYGVINRFIGLALEQKPITVYGDGTQLRDYIHVDDVVLAFLSLAAEKRCYDQVFNLGGREPLRLRDAVTQIAVAAGSTRIEFVPWPASSRCVETGDYYTDLGKLHAFLDLPCQISFAEGLRRTMPPPGARRRAPQPVATSTP